MRLGPDITERLTYIRSKLHSGVGVPYHDTSFLLDLVRKLAETEPLSGFMGLEDLAPQRREDVGLVIAYRDADSVIRRGETFGSLEGCEPGSNCFYDQTFAMFELVVEWLHDQHRQREGNQT